MELFVVHESYIFVFTWTEMHKKSAERESIQGCIEKFWRLAIENNPRIFACGNRRIVITINCLASIPCMISRVSTFFV